MIKGEITMTINVENKDGAVVLVLEGRLDTNTAPMLEKTISELPEDTSNLVLDMNKLEYISSAELRVLLATHKKISKVGTMKLTGVCDEVMEVFEMTGFVDFLIIE